MLRNLKISNVALISFLELDFCGKLNILSGETGAGKSILVDSLMLLLGGRYDKTLLRYGAPSGYVEGIFDSSLSANEILDSFGFDDDEIIIISRKFYQDGKNEIRINGRAATTAMLKTLMAVLVDIYGQNEYQSLAKAAEHLRILDYYTRGKSMPIKEKIAEKYAQYKGIIKSLNELGSLDERERNIDMLKFQLEEINLAKVKPDEEDELIAARRMIASVEKISTALSAVSQLMDDEDGLSASDRVSVALKSLGTISDINKNFEELYERLNSVSIELSDICDSAVLELENLNFNMSDLDAVEKRLDTLRTLKRKYGDYAHMLRFKEQAEQTLFKLEHCEELFEKLNKDRVKVVSEIYQLSLILSDIRKKGAKDFEVKIVTELKDLGMPNSVFEIYFEDFPKTESGEQFISPSGMDKVEFYLSPNVGQPLKPLVKIISGGEMSRFMLALKVVSSQTDDIPTMIFDEIDAGISGKIGQEVAKKLATISRYHQILCVTHLPQIASMADNHYYIVKNVVENQTQTDVSLLDFTGEVGEISRLSGGKDISSRSEENARQMKKWSDDFKSSLY